MDKKTRFNIFLKRATEMHGDKFTYREEDFVTYKTNMKIICPIHGEFQQKPDKHVGVNSKGCQKCWDDLRIVMLKGLDRSKHKVPILPFADFVSRSIQKYGSKFQILPDNYNGLVGNPIKFICPVHGEFLNKPINHLISSFGCPSCGVEHCQSVKTKDYDNFLRQAAEIYGNQYEYPEYNRFTYKNKKSKIDVICAKHGLFTKKAQKHLTGQACFPCKIEELIRNNLLVGGYSEDLFANKPELKNQSAFLYYLSINNGEMFKVGITRVSAASRISSLKNQGKEDIKSIEILKEIPMTLYQAFSEEQRILRDNDFCRVYTPWSSEIFSKDISHEFHSLPDCESPEGSCPEEALRS